MKILFVGSVTKKEVMDGPSRVGIEIFNRVKTKYPGIKFLSYFQDGKLYSKWKKFFGKSPFIDSYALSGILPLIIYIIKNRPQIIQIIYPSGYYIPSLFVAKILKIRILYMVHQNFKYSLPKHSSISEYEKNRFLTIENISIRMSNAIMVFSNQEKEILKSQKISKNKQIFIVENGINLFNVKKKYIISNDKCIKAITVGAFNREEKGLLFLLKFLEIAGNEVKLTICNNERHSVFKKGIPSNIEILYKTPLSEQELRHEFVKNDIFIASSSYEVFNISLLEAMNCGLHFIATQQIGLTERFNNELLEYVIPYGDIELGVKKINQLINLPVEEKQDLSDNIIAFSNNYSWDKVVEKYFEIYNNIK